MLTQSYKKKNRVISLLRQFAIVFFLIFVGNMKNSSNYIIPEIHDISTVK